VCGVRALRIDDLRTSGARPVSKRRALLGLDLTAWWRAYITVALMCGLRPGELLGLRWEGVDFKAGVIRVRKCLKALPDPVTGKRVLVLETLKTERSRRTIRMPRQVLAVLLALRKEQAAARLKLATIYDIRGLAIVFGDGAGAPKWPQDVWKHFNTLCGRAGISEHWTPREQRHSFVSVLSDAGVGSAPWLPNGSRTLGYLRWNRISVIPCEGIGSPRGGRRVP
jgi:integrase